MAHNKIKILLSNWHVYLSLHICTPAYWHSWFHHLYARRKLRFERFANTNPLQPIFWEPRKHGKRWCNACCREVFWRGGCCLLNGWLRSPAAGFPSLTAVVHVGWHLWAELCGALWLQPCGWLPPHHRSLPLPPRMVRWEPRAATWNGKHANLHLVLFLATSEKHSQVSFSKKENMVISPVRLINFYPHNITARPN